MLGKADAHFLLFPHFGFLVAAVCLPTGILGWEGQGPCDIAMQPFFCCQSAGLSLPRQFSCCLAASSTFLGCHWFYFCHIHHWPLILAILPTCALVLLGVLSCTSVSVHATISVCVFLLFNCGLDVFLQPGWRHDRLWEQALKLVPCLNLYYELERLSRC